jgi:hypothetical protein
MVTLKDTRLGWLLRDLNSGMVWIMRTLSIRLLKLQLFILFYPFPCREDGHFVSSM